MDEEIEQAIRRLLKTFGVKTDAALHEHLEQNPNIQTLRVRLILEDLTKYQDSPPQKPLHLEVEGEIEQK